MCSLDICNKLSNIISGFKSFSISFTGFKIFCYTLHHHSIGNH